MSASAEFYPAETQEARTKALAKLREEFPVENISKLPKVNCSQCTQAGRNGGGTCSKHAKVKCKDCGNWLTSGHIHLDYVGHAETTARLLDADPEWTWEPMATTGDGLPLFDNLGGLWIRLTIAGVTRIGYGSANGKTGPDAIKEVIGDAIRNGGMRFGVALDLWAKTDLHANERTEEPPEPERPAQRRQGPAEDQWNQPAPSGQLPPPSPLVPKADQKQHARMAILLKEKRGITDDGAARSTIAGLVERPLKSRTELSRAEANSVIEQLNAEPAYVPPAPLEDNPVRTILLGGIADASSPATLNEAGQDIAKELARGSITPAESDWLKAKWTARRDALRELAAMHQEEAGLMAMAGAEAAA